MKRSRLSNFLGALGVAAGVAVMQPGCEEKNACFATYEEANLALNPDEARLRNELMGDPLEGTVGEVRDEIWARCDYALDVLGPDTYYNCQTDETLQYFKGKGYVIPDCQPAFIFCINENQTIENEYVAVTCEEVSTWTADGLAGVLAQYDCGTATFCIEPRK